MQPLYKQASICAASPNGEKEEIHMAFPFDVGNQIVATTLHWVAQTPQPGEGRDTRAVRFTLAKNQDAERNPQFSGLLFFRPQGIGGGGVSSLPGLDGFGSLLVTKGVCRSILDPNTAVPPAELVRPFISFRRQQTGPALVFATLTFMHSNSDQMPTQTTGTEEFSHVEMVSLGDGIIAMDRPQGWDLTMKRTTVLLKFPPTEP